MYLRTHSAEQDSDLLVEEHDGKNELELIQEAWPPVFTHKYRTHLVEKFVTGRELEPEAVLQEMQAREHLSVIWLPARADFHRQILIIISSASQITHQEAWWTG